MSTTSEYYDEESLHDFLYSEIRSSLNLDHDTLDDAWEAYQRVAKHYYLDGNKLEWLSCALYVACRRNTPQQQNGNRASNGTGSIQNKIEGNMVSLTGILRSCSISLKRFFIKIRNWISMDNLSADFQKKLEQIEKNFDVTDAIFAKYKPIFEEVFKCPSQQTSRFSTKNRKVRKQPCNSLDIYTFCWTMFVFIKSNFSKIGDDLVNSYHLLLVCIDYCFSCVLSFDNYRDIINDNFYDALTKKFQCDVRNENRVSIIDILCEKFPGIPADVKHIGVHWFKSLLKRMIDSKDLKEKTNGIIDSDSIDFNFKNIKAKYESFVLNYGDFDECTFLNENANEELGTEPCMLVDPINTSIQMRLHEVFYDPTNKNLVPLTPLSSKPYLASRTPVKKVLTPITSATTSISRLHSMLMDHTNVPSKSLEKFFEMCENNPKEKIQETIRKLGEVFAEAYAKANQDASCIKSTPEYECVLTSGREYARKRLERAETFFYYMLEKLLRGEIMKRINRNKLSQALSKIAETDMFIRSLFVCSLEIIMFSYNLCNRVFPWVLDIFEGHPELKIAPYYLYKVIEPIIREEPRLSRDIVKHLNAVEEKILDNLAWTSDSPLWTLLARQSPPTCAEVSLNIFNQDQPRPNGVPFMNSPCVQLFKTEVNEFVPPLPQGNVSRQLFADSAEDANAVPGSGQQPQPSKEVDENSQPNQISPPTPPVKAQGKNAQLGLFFRKVYSLASLRLRDLFNRLKITDDGIQLKIWTCLEHVLQNHTHLMRDRHLDQIIMCSIYGITRINVVGEKGITFQDIIQEYRLQPQANGQVYREVLLTNTNGSDEKPPRGTVIDFYNKVFLESLTQAYILKFSSDGKNSNIQLSPMPRNKFTSPNINSPLRCVPNYPVFVSPLRSHPSPSKPISYRFKNNLDTSKDLENINNMMKSSGNNALRASIANAMVSMADSPKARSVSKRILQDDDAGSDSVNGNKKFCRVLNRKIRDMYSDLQTMSAASSSAASASVSDESNDSVQQFNLRRFSSSLNNGTGTSGVENSNNNGGFAPLESPVVVSVINGGNGEQTPILIQQDMGAPHPATVTAAPTTTGTEIYVAQEMMPPPVVVTTAGYQSSQSNY